MNLPLRIVTRLRRSIYNHIGRRLGHGNRLPPSLWEEQFADGTWDYLDDPAEAGHYAAIVGLLAGRAATLSVLDIGCGQGVLYDYLTRSVGMPLGAGYLGIDISKRAIELASRRFPETRFLEVDFERARVGERFDAIVFNESLYYFSRPRKTLARAIAENLAPLGTVVVSMCDYPGHDRIWSDITKRFRILDERETVNANGQRWKIKHLGV